MSASYVANIPKIIGINKCGCELKIKNSQQLHIYKKNVYVMLDYNYEGYGFQEPKSFVSIPVQKDLKYPPVKRVPQDLTEIGSFISEKGQPIGDLVMPEIGCSE